MVSKNVYSKVNDYMTNSSEIKMILKFLYQLFREIFNNRTTTKSRNSYRSNERSRLDLSVPSNYLWHLRKQMRQGSRIQRFEKHLFDEENLCILIIHPRYFILMRPKPITLTYISTSTAVNIDYQLFSYTGKGSRRYIVLNVKVFSCCPRRNGASSPSLSFLILPDLYENASFNGRNPSQGPGIRIWNVFFLCF